MLVSCTNFISRIASVGNSESERTNTVAELVSAMVTSSGIACFAVSVASVGHTGITFHENGAGSDVRMGASDAGDGCDSVAS